MIMIVHDSRHSIIFLLHFLPQQCSKDPAVWLERCRFNFVLLSMITISFSAILLIVASLRAASYIATLKLK